MLLSGTQLNDAATLWSGLQDYQEEISVAQENKQQLQAMGERLAKASQDNKAAEIQHKLNKVSERWQHLLDLIAARWGRHTPPHAAFSALFEKHVMAVREL